MILTHELIEAASKGAGGWTRAQLEALGVEWPPVRGWKARLVGREITEAEYGAFLELAAVRGGKMRKQRARAAIATPSLF